ncbi:outer dense fiber protein 2-like isoform X4 [Cyanistes caeruleus]|uniref:outer dense fiber protein 2-like isoform X4 n=1 Tax=Cyanistes caeruleus TaxID=156563 RepID=UPI000CDA2426|nr:outer dense fiber protein 2-like isoform X4 [Cyanistes caeruleus]
MSSSSQPSLSLPVHDCTAPSLNFDLQEKFILLHTVELNSKNIDIWTQELSEREIQNTNLRKKILEREKQIKELSSMLQCEKINTQKVDHLSRSVKEVQAYLQCQIERKEAENDELKVKIQTLENKIAEWELQIGEYKYRKLALKETTEQRKIALKKAIRSQKQRAQHLEESVKDITAKIRDHEVKLCEILSASDVWKNQYDRIVEGKTVLKVQIEDLEKELLTCLTSQIRGLMEDMEKREEWRRNSEEEILGKLISVTSENEKIYLENRKLKASLAMLEKSTVSVEYELLHLQEKAKLQENLVEQRKNEVQKRQIAVEELKSRYEAVLNENKKITGKKCLELDKDNHSVTSMGNLCLEEEICNIQKIYEDLQRQLGEMEYQNEELAYQLRKEDENLQSSKLQLEEKTAEYNALTRQLESALEEGRKMVAEEQEKMSYKEKAFQTKLLLLEAEVKKRQEEKNQLLCLFHHNEKHHEVRLKELENSLQKSENENQSLQNYVQFLKDAYVTMFG